MKKIFRYGAMCAAIGAFAFGTSSCAGFLEVEPTGRLTEKEAFADVASAQRAVMGLYSTNLRAMQGYEHLRTLVGTDEARQTYGRWLNGDSGVARGFDDYSSVLNGNASPLGGTWDRYWALITASGKVIAGLAADDSAEAKALVAEASFMRGLTMFRLSVLWGDIPIIDIDRQEEFGLARQPQDVVWEFIINDLKVAAAGLPETQSDAQRATKYSALAMLGKAYMYAEGDLRDYVKADACFMEIINSGKYDLVPSYAALWDNDKTPDETRNPGYASKPDVPDFKVDGKSESVYTVQFMFPPEGSYNTWCWGTGSWEFEAWFQGEKAWLSGYNFMVVNNFMFEDQNTTVDGDDTDFIDYEFPDPAPDGPQAKDKGVGVWEDGDQRQAASIRYRWSYYTDQFKEQPPMSFGSNNLAAYRKSQGDGVFMWIDIKERKTQLSDNMRDELNPRIKKFEDWRCDQFSDYGISSMYRTHKPFPMIRYADILLLHAECLNDAGKLSEAIGFVNQVRQRAWGGSTPPVWNPSSKEEFVDMVMDERMRELAFEGWRRADLIRTGKFVDLVKTRNDWAAINKEVDKDNYRWPIPIAEIVNNADSGWVQNPGYAE